jgi:hypothetical protein
MNQAAIAQTDSGTELTQSSGHFAPRLFNQSAADPVTGFYHQTAAANSRLVITYVPIEMAMPAPSDLPSYRGSLPHTVEFDLPTGDSFTDADAAALGLNLAQRRSGLPIIEVDLGSDL